MRMWEEAEKISIFGVEMYRFGFFAAMGMLAAAGVLALLCAQKRCKRGTAPLLTLLSLLLGGILSRVGFCLMNQELGFMMPLWSWAEFTGGGWSMIGAVCGILLAGWVTAEATNQHPGEILDLTACIIPVFFLFERLGEEWPGDPFNINYSRVLDSSFLNQTFLTVSDYDGSYLATRRLAAIVMGILFVILLADLFRSRRNGDTFVLFLMLFGACSILLESLRYDRFLSISFVGLEHILSAFFLLAGILILARRIWHTHRKLAVWSIISVFTAAGIALALEFALDRSTMNKILIYGIYVIVLSIPVALGIRMRRIGTGTAA